MGREKSGGALLSTLGAEHAEWRPLLSLVEAALGEMERPVWSESVPAREHSAALSQPLVEGAAFARAAGDDRGVLRVVGPIVAMPMLLACRRAWAALVPATWAEGYCPICGDWPSLAETRGLDGQRRLRCGRCGGDWRTERLRCPFCGERGHENLGSLVSEGREPQAVDVCERCRHYVKTLTALVPVRPEDVFLHDLATLVLDVIALERGYRRPAPKGRRVEVIARPSQLRTLFRLRPWTTG